MPLRRRRTTPADSVAPVPAAATAVPARRSAERLVDVEEPAWPELAVAIATAEVEVDIIPIGEAAGRRALAQLQVSAASTMGALALHTGGLAIERGWLRILGGGSSQLPSLATASGIAIDADSPPGKVIVGHDIVGGVFAVDGGELGLEPGHVCYLAPDTLQWEDLDLGHTAWVRWALTQASLQFWDSFRWSGWESEVSRIGYDQGVMFYPPPFTKEWDKNSRKVIPMTELAHFYAESARQLNGEG